MSARIRSPWPVAVMTVVLQMREVVKGLDSDHSDQVRIPIHSKI